MARKKETINIDGDSVELYQFPIPLALKVKIRLSKVLSKPLGALLSSGNVGKDGNFDIASVLDKNLDYSKLFFQLTTEVNEDEFINTIGLIMPYVTINGTVPKNLEYFDEKGLSFLYKVLWESLKLNYQDFLAGLLGEGEKEIATKKPS